MKILRWLVTVLLLSIPFISVSRGKEVRSIIIASVKKTVAPTKSAPAAKSTSAAHEDEHDHRHENLPAHIHGVGSLSIAIDTPGAALEMEYLVPANDLLGGFEHAPQTAAELKMYQDVSASLKSPVNVFQLVVKGGTKKAACETTQENINFPYDNIHDEEHAAGEEHDHAHEDHADFKIKYTFHCQEISELKGVKTLLFDKFPMLKELQVVVIDAKGARPLEINKTHPTVYFTEK